MHIQKKTIRAIMEIATGILAIIVIYFVIRHVSMRYSHNVTSVTDTAEVEKRTEFPEESINITLNGIQYKFLHKVKTYLFLGTDASGNEEGVGDAVAECGIDRKDLFITTKVWISNAGEEKAYKSILDSLKKLRTDYIDLLLIHQAYGDYYGTWRAMERA